jgi:hypothetical protein
LDELIPEPDYSPSPRWKATGRWRSDDREFDPLNFLIAVGGLLIIILLLLVAVQFASVDPDIRFGLLLLGLGVAAIVLIGRSSIGRNRQPSFTRGERRGPAAKNALQSTAETLDLAFEGYPFSQMLALQELKELLIDRLVLRKHVPRSVVMEMASDSIWLEEEVDQAELRSLLTIDLKGAYAPELSSSRMQQEMISAFPNDYRRILELLEEM